MHFAEEAAVQLYIATPYTHAMTNPAMEGGVIVTHGYTATSELPACFRTKGYSSPTDSRHCPFTWAYQTDLPYFDYLHKSSTSTKAFNNFMQGIRSTRKFWADWLNTESIVLDGFDFTSEGALIVDVGRGQRP